MEIRVELFLHFRNRAAAASAGKPVLLDLPAPATVHDVLVRLEIQEQAEKVVLVDGRMQPVDTPLRGGQTVTVFPPLDGG